MKRKTVLEPGEKIFINVKILETTIDKYGRILYKVTPISPTNIYPQSYEWIIGETDIFER